MYQVPGTLLPGTWYHLWLARDIEMSLFFVYCAISLFIGRGMAVIVGPDLSLFWFVFLPIHTCRLRVPFRGHGLCSGTELM